MHDAFSQTGAFIGSILRNVIEFLRHIFGSISGDLNGFFSGFTGALGVNHSLFRIILLIIGALFLFKGIRSFFTARLISGVIWFVIGIILLGWSIG